MTIRYDLDHILSYTGALAPAEMIGEVPEGLRVNFYSTSGDFAGPRLKGRVLPRPMLAAGLETLLVGGMAAALAFGVGRVLGRAYGFV